MIIQCYSIGITETFILATINIIFLHIASNTTITKIKIAIIPVNIPQDSRIIHTWTNHRHSGFFKIEVFFQEDQMEVDQPKVDLSDCKKFAFFLCPVESCDFKNTRRAFKWTVLERSGDQNSMK